jgi:hypothetical protein
MARFSKPFAFGLSLALLPFVFGGPISAEDAPEWTSAAGEGRCDLRYGSATSEVFAISYRRDTSYALNGEAFADAQDTGLVAGEIRVLAKGGSVLLNGDAEALEAQSDRTGEHPVPLFLAATAGGESFTVATKAGLEVIPLAGFAGPAAAFGECARALFLDLGPRPPVVLAFDGVEELVAAAERQGLLSDAVGFALKVDAEGRAVECTLGRGFQRAQADLCGPLLAHHRFDPARDQEGNPVPGIYLSRVDFRVLTDRDAKRAAEGW